MSGLAGSFSGSSSAAGAPSLVRSCSSVLDDGVPGMTQHRRILEGATHLLADVSRDEVVDCRQEFRI